MYRYGMKRALYSIIKNWNLIASASAEREEKVAVGWVEFLQSQIFIPARLRRWLIVQKTRYLSLVRSDGEDGEKYLSWSSFA